MANSSFDNNRNRQRGSSPRGQNRNRSRQGSRSRSSSNSANSSARKPLTRPDTGYTLHSRQKRSQGNLAATLMQPRVLILIVIVVVVIGVLFFGVTSCINRGNQETKVTTEETKPKNEQDNRVAAGVSAMMTSKFTEALDQADLLAQIAETANEYEDERLLTLALNEPSALQFVADYPTSDKSSSRYEDPLTRGDVPCLYNWDKRWGAVTYGDGPLAVTGSGPTTLAMAYMGLTGKADFTPTEIAQQASKANYFGNDSGTKGELFVKLPETMGLISESYEPSSDNFYSIGENTVFAVEVNAGTLTDQAHWVLVVNINADGSVTVFDPTSTAVSARPWDMNTIADGSTSFYSISASEQTLKDIGADKSGSDGTGGTASAKGANGSKSSSANSSKDGTTSTDETTEEDEYSNDEYDSSSDEYSEDYY